MNDERTNAQTGAIDQDDLEDAIRDALSPEAVVMIASYLQLVRSSEPGDEHPAARTAREVAWFRETLIGMVGFETYNQTLDELGL